MQTFWHGSQSEGNRLLEAIKRNCTCQITMFGVTTSVCELHKLFVADQAFLDHMAYCSYMRERYIAEEEDVRSLYIVSTGSGENKGHNGAAHRRGKLASRR